MNTGEDGVASLPIVLQDRMLAAAVAALLMLVMAAAPALAQRFGDLEDELHDLQSRHGVPLLVLVLLTADDEPRISVRRLDGAAAGAGTPFRWGSISKTVTSLTLLEAARRHDVSLDTPVAEIIEPPYRNPWAPQQPVRLTHLLELAAGLSDLSAAEFDDNTPRPLGEALARGAQRRVLLWPPGLQHSYSNVIPGISAAVVESLTGTSFEAAAERLVLTPLGMHGASFGPVNGLPGGYRAGGRSEIPYWHMTFRAFGALNASPAAMARLMTALLNGGRIDGRAALAAATVDRTFRVEATAGARHGLEIGYGAGLYGRVRGGHLFHGHGGDADGYRSRLGLLRRDGRGYLIGINVDDPELLGSMVRRVETALTADLTPPPPPDPDADVALEHYAGRYYPSSARFGIDRWRSGELEYAEVSARGGSLVVEHRGRRTPLLPVGGGRFRRPADPAVSVVFFSEATAQFMQGELGNFARVTAPCADFMPVCEPVLANRP